MPRRRSAKRQPVRRTSKRRSARRSARRSWWANLQSVPAWRPWAFGMKPLDYYDADRALYDLKIAERKKNENVAKEKYYKKYGHLDGLDEPENKNNNFFKRLFPFMKKQSEYRRLAPFQAFGENPWAFGAAKDAWAQLAKERAARNKRAEMEKMAKKKENYKRTRVLKGSGFYA